VGGRAKATPKSGAPAPGCRGRCRSRLGVWDLALCPGRVAVGILPNPVGSGASVPGQADARRGGRSRPLSPASLQLRRRPLLKPRCRLGGFFPFFFLFFFPKYITGAVRPYFSLLLPPLLVLKSIMLKL